MMRAADELVIPKTKACRPCQSSSVGHRTVRPVVEQFDPQIPNVRENPRHSSESEQIRILLERHREQTLADYRAVIHKHEFQDDYDRNIQKLNEVIESQKGEIYRRTTSTRSTNKALHSVQFRAEN